MGLQIHPGIARVLPWRNHEYIQIPKGICQDTFREIMGELYRTRVRTSVYRSCIAIYQSQRLPWHIPKHGNSSMESPRQMR